MGVARQERLLLCDLFDVVGPDAPTLCAGWRTRDLAAHLVLRERRPDAMPGIALGRLAGYTRRVQDHYAGRPWRELVDLVRTGPPAWSPYAIPAVDELVNTTELFVHHEDVRRAAAEWVPREPDADRDAALWRAVCRVGRLAYRRSPVGVVLRCPDGPATWVKRGPRAVTLQGAPGELLLHACGRDQARVDFGGDQDAIARVRGLRRGF